MGGATAFGVALVDAGRVQGEFEEQERLATRRAADWFDALVAAGVPAAPINTIDGGFAMAERFGLDPVVEVGEGERTVPTTRHPITFSTTPARYELPPPELDEHGPELRKWLATPHTSRARQEEVRD